MPDDDAGVDLTKLLDEFFADNLLEYTCEKCGHKESRASHAMHRLPRFLVIHCKRFKPNFEKGIYEKLTTRVNAPRSLDLGKHCSAATRAPPTCAEADRIQVAALSPCNPISSSVAADQTRSTKVKATGARVADESHGFKSGGGGWGRGTGIGFEDVLKDEEPRVTRKLVLDCTSSPEEERGGSAYAGKDLRTAQKDKPRYGTSAQHKRGAETDGANGTHKRGRLDFQGSMEGQRRRQSREEQEAAELELALQRSKDVTHRSNWMEDEEAEASARPRERERANEERTRSRVRLADGPSAESAPINIDDDDDTLEKEAEIIAKKSGVLGMRQSTPEKVDGKEHGKDREGHARGKVSFDKDEFSLGNEEEDLARALAMSAQDGCDVQIVDPSGDVEKAEEVNEEEERADSPVDLSASDDEEPAKGVIDSTPPAAGYTLQVFLVFFSLRPVGCSPLTGALRSAGTPSCSSVVTCHRPFPSCPLVCKRMCLCLTQAVVSHVGKSAAHGHYVSDIFIGSKGAWSRYDDAIVTTLGDASQAQAKDWPSQGYIFVYAHDSCLVKT